MSRPLNEEYVARYEARLAELGVPFKQCDDEPDRIFYQLSHADGSSMLRVMISFDSASATAVAKGAILCTQAAREIAKLAGLSPNAVRFADHIAAAHVAALEDVGLLVRDE